MISVWSKTRSPRRESGKQRTKKRIKAMSSAITIENFPVTSKSKRLVVKLKRCRLIVDSTTSIPQLDSQQGQQQLLGQATDRLCQEDERQAAGTAPIRDQEKRCELPKRRNDEKSVPMDDFSTSKKRARLDSIIKRLQCHVNAANENAGLDTQQGGCSDQLIAPPCNQRDGEADDHDTQQMACDEPLTTVELPEVEVDDLNAGSSQVHADIKADETDRGPVTMAKIQNTASIRSSPRSSSCINAPLQGSQTVTPQQCKTNVFVELNTKLLSPSYNANNSKILILKGGKCTKQQTKAVATMAGTCGKCSRRDHRFVQPRMNYLYFPKLTVLSPCTTSPPMNVIPICDNVCQGSNYWNLQHFQPSHIPTCMVPALPQHTGDTSVVVPWLQQCVIPNVVVPCCISSTRKITTVTKQVYVDK